MNPMQKPGDPKDPMKPGDAGQDKVAKNDPAEAKPNNDGPGESKPMQPGQPGAEAGGGNRNGTGGVADDTTGAAANPAPEERGPIADPNKDFKDRAGDLDIDKFKDKVTPEMLQKYGISEAEWKRYLENAAKSKTQPNPSDARNDTKGGDRSGSSNLNKGVRKVENDPNAKMTDIRSGGADKAPPEYQDAAAKFSRLLSEGKTKK